uniref:Uncharacterized protein n=1 Tax=Rhizophora mucronata TaxID=61149 RepID=A0A2P2QCY9_RHIMU
MKNDNRDDADGHKDDADDNQEVSG